MMQVKTGTKSVMEPIMTKFWCETNDDYGLLQTHL